MNEKMKKCPYCGEEILKKAIKCKYCEENIEEQDSVIFKDGYSQNYSKVKNKAENSEEINKFNWDTFWGICSFALFLLVIFSLGFLLFNSSFEKGLFEVYKNDEGKYCFKYNYYENYIINEMTSCHEVKEAAEAYAKCYKSSTEGLKEMAETLEQGGFKNNTSTLLEKNVVTDFTVFQCLGAYQPKLTPQQKAQQEAQDRARQAEQRAEEVRQEEQQVENIRKMKEQEAQSLQEARDYIRKKEQKMKREQQILEQKEEQTFLNQVKATQEQSAQNNYNSYQQEQTQQPQYVNNPGYYPQQQPQYVHKKGNYSYKITSPQQQNINTVQPTSSLYQTRTKIDEANGVTNSVVNGLYILKGLTRY